jgi:hypothetical protein
VSVAADLTVAYVSLCCASPVGTILETTPPASATADDTMPQYGFAPTLNPSATLLAFEVQADVVITRLASDETMVVEPQDGNKWDSVHDLTWIDDTTLAVLGNQSDFWSLTIVTIDASTIDVGPTRSFARFEDFAYLRFAGSAGPGEIALHDVGTNRVLNGTIDDYGNHNGERGSSLEVIELPGLAQSAWYFDLGQLIWVDAARTLRVDDREIPGDYLWARR